MLMNWAWGRCSRDVVPAAYCAGWNGLLGLIEKAPTVDAVVVTRCKDCARYRMGVCRKAYTDGTCSPQGGKNASLTIFAATANRRRGNAWTLLVERLLKRGRLMCASVAGANSSKGL